MTQPRRSYSERQVCHCGQYHADDKSCFAEPNHTNYCKLGFHTTGELLVDAVDEEDRVYRCNRCGAEWSPDHGELLEDL